MQLILSAGSILAIVLWGLLSPDSLRDVFNEALAFITHDFGWLYLWVVLSLVILAVYLAFSRYGNMKLGNEIDAVTAHGINPLAYLAVPRLIGVALANAALTVWMCAAAYLGCFLVAPLLRAVSLPQFLKILADAVSPGDLLRCVSAGLLFGLAIPAVAVYHGMNVPRDINEIPRAGSRAVVESLLVIFALAAALSFAG